MFTGYELVRKACEIIVSRLQTIYNKAGSQNIPVAEADTTMPWSIDITLENESYTIGKVLEFIMHKKYFKEGKLLKFIGFRQAHPHDTDSFIRVAFNTQSADNAPTYDKFKIASLSLIQTSDDA